MSRSRPSPPRPGWRRDAVPQLRGPRSPAPRPRDRAYGLLNQILDEIENQDVPGSKPSASSCRAPSPSATSSILPLHGAPRSSASRPCKHGGISRRLDRFIELGRADGSIRATVNATDVIVFSALITQPLPHGPGWPLIAGRQLAIFVNGLAASGPTGMPGPP